MEQAIESHKDRCCQTAVWCYTLGTIASLFSCSPL